MSLNFGRNSNLSSRKKVSHYEKIVKICQFYSDSSRFFFATNCFSVLSSLAVNVTNSLHSNKTLHKILYVVGILVEVYKTSHEARVYKGRMETSFFYTIFFYFAPFEPFLNKN
jgi:hypothetical protein